MRGGLHGPALGAAVTLLLAGSAAAVRAETIKIKIEKLAFTPVQVSARAGDTIQWVNSDFVAHTATARNGAFDVMIPPNGKASVVLKAAGAVPYYCKLHPNMTGQISVK